MNSTIDIGARRVGGGAPCFITAEIAQTHDGSLGMAQAFIDAVAETGADSIKFQTHIAAAESTRDEVFRVPLSGQDATRYDYWQRMEFTPEQWGALKARADQKDLIFLSSPFSLQAVDLLKRIGMPAWKVGSGEFRSWDLLDAMAAAGGPILLSSGMSRYDEIDAAVERFRAKKTPFALFQCTSRYPTPLKDVGLNVIDALKARYGCPVGLSDQTGVVHSALAAMARGADLLEVHVTFDKRMYGPDVPASVTVDELKFLCAARDAFHTMLSHPVDKDAMAEEMSLMRALFTKSIAPVCALAAGTALGEEMLAPKKPGGGISYDDRKQVVGRKLVRDVAPDRLLREEDLEPQGS